jgi:hypothetical protein
MGCEAIFGHKRSIFVLAMMSAAHCRDDSKGKIALECIRTATMLDGLKVVQVGDVTATRDVHVYGSNPAWALNLRTFGEAGEVKDGLHMMSFGSKDSNSIVSKTMTLFYSNTTEKLRKKSLVLIHKKSFKMLRKLQLNSRLKKEAQSKR